MRSRRANVAGPTPPEISDRQWVQKIQLATRLDDPHTSAVDRASRADLWLRFLRSELGQELGPCYPDRTPQLLLFVDLVANTGPDRRTITEQAKRSGDVEERLVERERFDQRGVRAKDGHDPTTDLAIQRMIAGQKDGVGTQALRTRRRHRREDAVRPSLV